MMSLAEKIQCDHRESPRSPNSGGAPTSRLDRVTVLVLAHVSAPDRESRLLERSTARRLGKSVYAHPRRGRGR